MVRTRDELKGTFINGAKPDEHSYADLFDSFVHLHDEIANGNIVWATKAEAEQGFNQVAAMNPLRTQEAIRFLVRLASLPDLNADVVAKAAQEVAALVAGAPTSLNTIEKLANAIGNDPTFNESVLKVANNLSDLHDVSQARDNLEVMEASEVTAMVAGVFNPAGWQVAAMQGTWVAATEPLRFNQVGNLVFVSGTCQSGTSSHICTLPPGLRPQYNFELFQEELFRLDTSGELHTLTVYAPGNPAPARRVHFTFISI